MGKGHRRSVGARPRVQLGFSARSRRQARSARRSATAAATGEARQRPATRRRRRRDVEDLDHGCGNHSGLQDRPPGRAWGRPAAAEPEPCSRQERQPPTPRHLTRDIAPGPSPHPTSRSRPCAADQAPSDAPRQAQRAVPVTCGVAAALISANSLADEASSGHPALHARLLHQLGVQPAGQLHD